MSNLRTEFKEQYGNGKQYKTIFRIIELFGVAAVVGIMSMYGSASAMKGEMKQLSKQVTELATCVNQHIQNYSIHVPHK